MSVPLYSATAASALRYTAEPATSPSADCSVSYVRTAEPLRKPRPSSTTCTPSMPGLIRHRRRGRWRPPLGPLSTPSKHLPQEDDWGVPGARGTPRPL
eukprot:354542-Chlamydomonas_euryale.AAC.6